MKKTFFIIQFYMGWVFSLLFIAQTVLANCEIGAFVGNEDHRAPFASEVKDFESLAGRHLNSALVYWAWNDGNFPFEDLNSGVRYHDGFNTNTTLHLTWEPWSRLGANDTTYPLDRIINGDFDSYISNFAQDCAMWSDTIRLRFAHEMIHDNNPDTTGWYPWQDRPTEYNQAYNHVYQIFKNEGADNVEFVWSPNNYPANLGTLSLYYPGKDKVDWLGMDGYNFGEDGQPGWPSWQNFDDLFYNLYHVFIEHPEIFGDKKIMLAEFASAEGGEFDLRDKSEWITMAFLRIKQNYPEIDAFYWFNLLKEKDWRINSSEESLAAFQSAIQDPYYTSHLIPEPNTMLLFGLGLFGTLARIFKKLF